MGRCPLGRALCLSALHSGITSWDANSDKAKGSTAGTSTAAMPEEHPFGQGSLKEARGKKQAKPSKVLGVVFEYFFFL